MKSYLCLFALLADNTLALADTATHWAGASEISFAGTSTLHDWTGKVTASPFTANVTLNAAGQPEHIQSSVSVAAKKMDTADADRDENMRKAMKVPEFPLIQASIDASAEKVATDGKTPNKLPMTMTLLGKSQHVEGTISHWKLQGNRATFDLDFSLSLKSSGIVVPPMLLFIRVGDAVKVHASVTLAKH